VAACTCTSAASLPISPGSAPCSRPATWPSPSRAGARQHGTAAPEHTRRVPADEHDTHPATVTNVDTADPPKTRPQRPDQGICARRLTLGKPAGQLPNPIFERDRMTDARSNGCSEPFTGSLHGFVRHSMSRCSVAGLAYTRMPRHQKPWRSPSRPSERITSPSATASGAPNRFLCPDPVRHMSVINRPIEHATANCDVPCSRIERVVDAGLVESPRRSARDKRMQHRSVRTVGRQARTLARVQSPC